ncbi:CaiB/BaiF CoA transferase family protein [Xanthobacter tagetidis]|nr:CaiB/BaiF CoA-transferase family protein [Xanthobacter tagetidis]MBB6305989.1 crotonobetainyl-CoA:carnitine CoA-transferase CaiB-like acyl-CoA transferase [Xanthobacter tagetidis]
MSDPRAISPGAGPLAGMKVLELGSTVAGPFCGRLLADFGAEVVKVEPPEGDVVRTMGKMMEGKSLYAASIFRNKRLVSLDMRTEAGRALVREMAARCDVLVENFRPGSMEKWGMGYDVLSRVNPGLVLVRISGFGQTGPYSTRPGYGVIGEAVSGMRHITGDPDRPPARVSVSLTDYITGLYAAFGASMALLARSRTGRGQVVDAALSECAFSFMEPHVPAYDKLGHVAGRTGSALPGSVPNNLYPTADDSFVHITAMGDAVFARLCAAMGRADLSTDPRFAKAKQRVGNVDALDAIIAEWTVRLPRAELEALLIDAAVPATRIFTMADIFADPHYAARGMLVNAPSAEFGEVVIPGIAPVMSQTAGAVRHAGRRIGQDTRAVLADWLGTAGAELDALERAGVIQQDKAARDAASGERISA